MSSALLKKGKDTASKAATQVVKDITRERDKALKRSEGSIRKKDDPVDGLVRAAAALVGFVSEIAHYRRERKACSGSEAIDEPRESNGATTPEQINEAIWQQDDAERESAPQNSTPPKEPSDLANAFLKRHPFGRNTSSQMKIESPVVLPQRRPKTRARGFVRAYSPVLANADIDQVTFHDFIDTFNKALEPNPYLHAINLAGLAGIAAPEPFTLLVDAAVGFATDVTMEAQSRYKSNKFLDRLNAEFFIPRGLVCIVATWKPEAIGDNQLLTTVDFEGRMLESPPRADLGLKIKDMMTQKTSIDETMKNFQKQVQGSMRCSDGDFHWPEPAPLIFPSTEQTATALGTRANGNKKNAMDRGEIWLDEFMDKRAQAKWVQKNPTSTAASPMPTAEFRSRYADPNHPASSGDIVAFVTGGEWSTRRKKDAADNAERDLTDQGKQEPKESKKSSSSKHGDSKSSSSGFISGFLQKDMMYLIIVNLPSNSGMAEAATGVSSASTEMPAR